LFYSKTKIQNGSIEERIEEGKEVKGIRKEVAKMKTAIK
jgi:hypothetical protein